MAYIGNSPDLIRTGRRAQYHFTATASQTVFSGTDDNGLQLDLLDDVENDVYFNGSRLILDDDYTISGNTLTLTSGAAAGDILVIVTQDDVQNFSSYTKAEADSRYLNIDGDITAGDLQVVGEISATSFGEINLADNVKAKFGASGDLQIWHDGSYSRIDDTGTGPLVLRAANSLLIEKYGGDYMALFQNDGPVTLYYDNAAKIATTSTGIDVTGTVTADGLTVDNGSADGVYAVISNTEGGSKFGTDGGYIRIKDGSDTSIMALSQAVNYISNNGIAVLKTESGGDISFYDSSGSTAKFFWDASAVSLGIGTTSPSELLDVYSQTTNARIQVQTANSSSVPQIEFRNTQAGCQVGMPADTNAMVITVADTEQIRITSDDTVGIGTASPTEKLEVAGNVKASDYILEAIDKDITGTAVGVYIYDTSLDSDGGAWRKRTQNTSWYNETLNTSKRGSRREFPAVAVLVWDNSALTIYDGDDPDLPMWMVFDAGYAKLITPSWSSQNPRPTDVKALNGTIFVGSTSNYNMNNSGLTKINFISEDLFSYMSWGGTQSSFHWSDIYNVRIVDRNSTLGIATSYGTTGIELANGCVLAVAVTTLPNAPTDEITGMPVPTIAVGTGFDGTTQAGITIIKDSGKTHHFRYTGNNSGYYYSTCEKLYFDKETLYFSMDNWNAGQRQLLRINVNDWNADIDRTGYSTYDWGGTLLQDTGDVYGNAHLSPFYGYFQNDLAKGAIATTSGLGLFYDPGASSWQNPYTSGAMVASITKDYNSGWQLGNIKLATLGEISTTTLTDGNHLENHDFSAGDLSSWTLTAADSAGGIYALQDPVYVNGTVGIGNTGSVRQDVNVVSGKKYLIGYYTNRVSSSLYRLGIYFSHIGSSVQFDELTNVGGMKYYVWTSAYTGSTQIQFRGRGGGDGEFDNFEFMELDTADMSFNQNGVATIGTITKSAVSTGAELAGYSGFSNSNYLTHAGQGQFDFSGDFTIMGWAKPGSDDEYRRIFSYENAGGSQGDTDAINIKFGKPSDASNLLQIYFYNGSTGSLGLKNGIAPGVWTHFCFSRQGTRLTGYQNGVEISATNTTQTMSGGQHICTIGKGSNGSSEPAVGCSLALFKVSESGIYEDQIRKIYEEERVLFEDNAKCTLYGSHDNVHAVARDEVTNLVHAGTDSGRSVFQGLQRVDNTTDAVTVSISACNNMVVEE